MEKAADTFIANDEGPPTRRFWIARDPSSTQDDLGWSFIFDELVDGSWRPGWDIWEEKFVDILRYPPAYQSKPLIWRREIDGSIVDFAELQQTFG